MDYKFENWTYYDDLRNEGRIIMSKPKLNYIDMVRDFGVPLLIIYVLNKNVKMEEIY